MIKQIINITIPIIFILSISCLTDNKPNLTIQKLDTNKTDEKALVTDSLSYADFLKTIPEKLKNKSTTEKQNIVFNLMYNNMTSYWCKTDWDFNGTTQQPQQGSIACGYLVTTILEDLGLKINRIQLAQAVSSKMINKLCKANTIKRFSSINSFSNHIKTNGLPLDVYIIGLDYHTGFILKKENQLYFFHSDYFEDQVIIEKVEDSYNLSTSKSFMVGSLLQNTTLINTL